MSEEDCIYFDESCMDVGEGEEKAHRHALTCAAGFAVVHSCQPAEPSHLFNWNYVKGKKMAM